MADFLVNGQDFPSVVEKLEKAFPAAETKRMTMEEIGARLDGIRPGFLEIAGPLLGPTSIPRIGPSACSARPKAGKLSYVMVDNDTANPLEVSIPDIPERWKDVIPAHASRYYGVDVGASLKPSDGTCLVARDELTLAVIGN